MLAAIGAAGTMIRFQAQPPHEMIDIEDGRRLHVLCEGEPGAPFVLYDAGAFGIYADGWWIKEELKSDHRVCLYDRAGMGWSDPPKVDDLPSPGYHLEDIRRLRAALGETEPFVFVGHSMAGLRLHAWANTYPEELRGLVFIDAARPQGLESSRIRQILPWAVRAMHVSAGLARVGVLGGIAPLLPDEIVLPPVPKAAKTRSMAAVRHHKATRREIEAALSGGAVTALFAGNGAESMPVSVFTNSAGGGANGPVAQAAARTTGFGRVTVLPDESHVSLLNQANAARIAADVRAMTNNGGSE